MGSIGHEKYLLLRSLTHTLSEYNTLAATASYDNASLSRLVVLMTMVISIVAIIVVIVVVTVCWLSIMGWFSVYYTEEKKREEKGRN